MTMYCYTKEHENSIRRVEGSICLSVGYEKKKKLKKEEFYLIAPSWTWAFTKILLTRWSSYQLQTGLGLCSTLSVFKSLNILTVGKNYSFFPRLIY